MKAYLLMYFIFHIPRFFHFMSNTISCTTSGTAMAVPAIPARSARTPMHPKKFMGKTEHDTDSEIYLSFSISILIDLAS